MNRSSEFINREDHVRKIPVYAKSPSKTLHIIKEASEGEDEVAKPFIVCHPSQGLWTEEYLKGANAE